MGVVVLTPGLPRHDPRGAGHARGAPQPAGWTRKAARARPAGPARKAGRIRPAGHHGHRADVHAPVGQVAERGGGGPGGHRGRVGVRRLDDHDQLGRGEPLAGHGGGQGGRGGPGGIGPGGPGGVGRGGPGSVGRGGVGRGVGRAGQDRDPPPGDHLVTEPGQPGQRREPDRRRLRGEDVPQHGRDLGFGPR